jgi:two-component system nitrogen regulation response regulator NtrX
MGDSAKRALRVLVVEDDDNQRQQLLGHLEDEGYEASGVSAGEQALEVIVEEPPDLVILDLHLPGIDGSETLERIKEKQPSAEVLMLTGAGSSEAAFRAGRHGAFAYLEKSSDTARLLFELEKAGERARLRKEVRALELGVGPDAIVGQSKALEKVLETVDRVASSSAKILVTGENGTGKDLFARRVHAMSRRSEQPFIKLNCAAIPKDLVESELFGHEKGAFTGALQSKKGKLEVADKGSLFLDEIGDLSTDAQAKLLRAIETGEVERVGGTRTQVVDVRLISATNKDLEREVSEERFREDLYFRINVVPIHVPALRERTEDIELLAHHFLSRVAAEEGMGEKELSSAALVLLQGYGWPGNVRELRNLMERAMLLVDGPFLEAADLEPWLRRDTGGSAKTGDAAAADSSLKVSLEQQEAEAIRRELEATRWNVTQAAARLGLDRTNLHRKMRKYGIRRREEESE